MEHLNTFARIKNDSAYSEAARKAPSGVALEKHYSVAELAGLWELSERTIRRIFSREPGVLQVTHGETKSKRGYSTLRVPETVVQRVHRRLQGTA